MGGAAGYDGGDVKPERKHLAVIHPHREPPAPRAQTTGEHFPVCDWCMWSGGTRPFYCFEPFHNAVQERRFSNDFNVSGSCDRYRPTVWTRLLQALRIRPWIERPVSVGLPEGYENVLNGLGRNPPKGGSAVPIRRGGKEY